MTSNAGPWLCVPINHPQTSQWPLPNEKKRLFGGVSTSKYVTISNSWSGNAATVASYFQKQDDDEIILGIGQLLLFFLSVALVTLRATWGSGPLLSQTDEQISCSSPHRCQLSMWACSLPSGQTVEPLEWKCIIWQLTLPRTVKVLLRYLVPARSGGNIEAELEDVTVELSQETWKVYPVKRNTERFGTMQLNILCEKPSRMTYCKTRCAEHQL